MADRESTVLDIESSKLLRILVCHVGEEECDCEYYYFYFFRSRWGSFDVIGLVYLLLLSPDYERLS